MNRETKKTYIFLGVAAGIFFVLWLRAIVASGYAHCVVFQFTRSASEAFLCGNYYFGVFGPDNYNVAKAEYYFGKAVSINPELPDAWHQYARTAFLRGDFNEAIVRINRQFEERGDERMAAYYIRGLIYGYDKKYPEAERDFKKFIEWDPNNWAANNDLAWVYFAQGKFSEAKMQAEVGLVRNELNPWLHMMHAMARFNLGEREGVIEELELAKEGAASLTEENWSRAYPGNDPKIAGKGLAAFRAAIETNIEVVNKAISSP